MNMEDIYYNKYIKYKTKYLELKELNGGMNLFKGIGKIYNYTLGKKSTTPTLTSTQIQPTLIPTPIPIQQQQQQQQQQPIQQQQQQQQPIQQQQELDSDEEFSAFTDYPESTESTESTESIISNRSNYGNQYNKINEKIVLFKEAYKINEKKREEIKNLEKNISTDELNENLYNNKNIYKTKIIDNIVSIEDYLLNTLLPELYNNNNNKDIKNIHDNLIIIYINICRIIINYREYFYSKHNYNEKYINSIKQNIKEYIKNIKNKLNLGKINLKKLKNIIKLYFENVNDSIEYLDSFTYKSKNLEKENDCLFTYINNNIINFTENSIFAKIKTTFLKILNNKENLKNKLISLYNIKEILKIYVLITFKNNTYINNIDNIMMLINCYLIIINNMEILKDDANLNNNNINYDLYLQNLLFEKKTNDIFSFDKVFDIKENIFTGGANEEQIIKSDCGKIEVLTCQLIMSEYYNCDKIKFNILYIFLKLENILELDISKKEAKIGYQILDTPENNKFYNIKDQEERIEFNKQLKYVIENFFKQYFKNDKEILKIMKKLIV